MLPESELLGNHGRFLREMNWVPYGIWKRKANILQDCTRAGREESNVSVWRKKQDSGSRNLSVLSRRARFHLKGKTEPRRTLFEGRA